MLVFLLFLALAPSALPQVVISQIYGGGGNAGARYRNDFIELFNRGDSPVDINAWSVQYASSAGSSWQVTNLSGTLAPGQYYLVQQSQGAGGTENLPPPDGSGQINMSATAGKVALVNNRTQIAAGVSCPTAGVVDFVGFGAGTNCFEGPAPTAVLSNTTAALRKDNGCTDDGRNNTDFLVQAPAPRNRQSPFVSCSAGLTITTEASLPNASVNSPYRVQLQVEGNRGEVLYTLAPISGPLPGWLTLSPTGVLSGTPGTSLGSPHAFTVRVRDAANAAAEKSFELAVDGPAVCVPTHKISQIQGNGPVSPLANNTPVTASGVVTGVRTNGFYMQSATEDEDGDPETSEGLFVFTSTSPGVSPGMLVCVTGPLLEFAPAGDPASPAVTEISQPRSVSVIAVDQPLPAPVTLRVEDTGPAGGLHVLERYEGMRVEIAAMTVVAPTEGTVNEAAASSASNGVFFGVVQGVARPFREPGIEAPNTPPAGSAIPPIPRFDANPERIAVESRGQVGGPALDVAAGQVLSNVVGVLDYRLRRYTLAMDAGNRPQVNGEIAASPVPAAEGNELTLAALNLERFFDTVKAEGSLDTVLSETAFQRRLAKASLAIRDVLRVPDVLAVMEVENLPTLRALAAKINSDAEAAGQPNPNYAAYLEEGNDPAGIDVGFLVKTPKVTVLDVTQAGKSDTYLDPLTNQQATLHDRPPLVLRARATGLPFTAVAVHPRSMTGVDDPVEGRRVRAKRRAQAEAIGKLVQARQEADAAERIAVLGDFNAFPFNDGYVDVVGIVLGNPTPPPFLVLGSADLVNPDLVNTIGHAPEDQRYSFVFAGNAQALDQILVNTALEPLVTRVAYGRMNADFPESLRNDASRPERISDHDAPIVYLRLPAAVEVTPQVSFTVSGLTLNRTTLLYEAKVTVTNNGAPIDGPVVLLLSNLTGGVTLANATGATNGLPYLVTAGGALGAGESRDVGLVFRNPSNGPVSYTPRLFSGSF
ncbi:MAG: lamin tail domain-containing protein [Bryobacterales bacterium]|nr:lamin tail domain-containing protein [Bryobacterales bacterium]